MVHGKNRSAPYTSKSRFYDVLIKRNGGWKGVASHVMRGLPTETPSRRAVRNRSAIWNTAFNNHDTTTVTSLFDSTGVLITGGARQIGKENCRLLFKGLFTRRPDITSYNWPVSIEVNEKWQVAYETGNWIETWTEKGDNELSEIKGKYCLMWRYSDGDWHIISAIFTPLQCSGNYCNKR
jgi:ketosteroid isomerase-like protein